MNFKKFPEEKDCADYLLEFNRDVKEWRKATVKELEKRIEDAEKAMKTWTKGGPTWHKIASQHGYWTLKDFLEILK